MKCVICKSTDIQQMKVDDEIKSGEDIVLIPLEVLVCHNCGERYYDKKNMKKIEEVRYKLKTHELKFKQVGKVLRANVA